MIVVLRVSMTFALSMLTVVSLPRFAEANDLESKVKYEQMRAHWKIEEGRQKIEGARAKMQQNRADRARKSSSQTSPVNTYGHGSRGLSSAAGYVQPAGNGMSWYTNKQYNFRGLFVGQPQITAKPGPFGTTCNIFGYSNNQGATMISVTELPAMPGDQASINKSLNGAVDGSIRSTLAVETSRYSCSLQGHPGREFTANIPAKNGKMKSRLFLANKRLYQVLVVGENSFVDSSYGQMFIKAFSFL